MTSPAPPVRLVLDRSALLAYLAGSMHVAETVGEVTWDAVSYGVPAVVVAETLALVGDGHDRMILRRLLDAEMCALLDTHGDQWDELAYWRRVTGRIDLAAAAMAALDHDAALLTAEDKLYGDDLPVIGIPC